MEILQIIIRNQFLFQKFVKNNYRYTSVEKFDKDKYESFESHEIRSDEDIFIFHMPNNRAELWQIGSKVVDYFGNIIPGLYHIRKIGAFTYAI